MELYGRVKEAGERAEEPHKLHRRGRMLGPTSMSEELQGLQKKYLVSKSCSAHRPKSLDAGGSPRILAVGTEEGYVFLLDDVNMRDICGIQLCDDGYPFQVSFSPEGDWLFCFLIREKDNV